MLYADIVLILDPDSHAAIHWEEVISPSHVRDTPLTALAFEAVAALPLMFIPQVPDAPVPSSLGV